VAGGEVKPPVGEAQTAPGPFDDWILVAIVASTGAAGARMCRCATTSDHLMTAGPALGGCCRRLYTGKVLA